MATVRFEIPADQAAVTLSECSDALTALFALDAHMQQHLKWLAEAAEAFGKPPDLDDEADEGRAGRRERADRPHARAAHAISPSSPPTPRRSCRRARRRAARSSASTSMPFLPDTLGPKELIMVERSFSAGMARYVHNASISLRPLRRACSRSATRRAALLAGHIDAFLAAVHA